jgi:hypothetical protein
VIGLPDKLAKTVAQANDRPGRRTLHNTGSRHPGTAKLMRVRGAVGVGFDVRGVHASAHDGDAVAAEPGLFRCRSPLAAVPDDHRDVPFVADPGEVAIDRDVADSPNPSRGADGGTTIRGEPLIPLSVNRIRQLPNEQRQASAEQRPV